MKMQKIVEVKEGGGSLPGRVILTKGAQYPWTVMQLDGTIDPNKKTLNADAAKGLRDALIELYPLPTPKRYSVGPWDFELGFQVRERIPTDHVVIGSFNALADAENAVDALNEREAA